MKVRRLELQNKVDLIKFFDRISDDPTASSFHPHPFTVEQAELICSDQGKDIYLGGFTQEGSLVAYGLLRGWDEGFEVPSLGIYIAPEMRGSGASKALMNALHEAAVLAGAIKIMLKVYPDNAAALALYSSIGYRFEKNIGDQIVGYLDLDGMVDGN